MPVYPRQRPVPGARPRTTGRLTRLPVRVATLLILLFFSVLGLAGTAFAQDPVEPTTPAVEAPAESAPADVPADAVPVSGRLMNSGTPVPDATVTATDSSGTVAAETTSDADGRWQLQVSPGSYTFGIDESSLPDGTSVQGTVDREIVAGRSNTVIFSFGEARTSIGTPLWERFVRTTIDGLRFGLIIAITAVGVSLIFGTTGLTNFSHGEMVTFGAVIAWMFNVKMGLHLIPASILAIIVGGAFGWAYNAGVWRPLRKRRTGLIAQLVVSIGLGISLRYLILIFYSDRSNPFNDYQGQVEHDWGPFSITNVNIACIVISTIVLIGVALMLQKTRIGKAMRAVADNRDLAASSGINVERIVTFVWVLGGALAALGGVLFALSELGGRVQWEMGFKLLLLMFAGITLGGLGTAYGALLGCIIVGLFVQWSTMVIDPDLKYVSALLILIIILIVRPQGILGSRQRIG